ncbi:hypothetical protein Scep_030567 [Stephania cephalantha]|uniref:Uncharacterized protein n=1 Tax=Stephania cephalantha TaxID=152367 RepID=A0AAP0E009_9MAGN
MKEEEGIEKTIQEEIYQKLSQIKEAVMELIKEEKDKKKWKLLNAVFEMLNEIKVADTEDFKNAVTNQFETEGRVAVETLKLAYMAVEETMKKRESAKRLKSKGEDDEESHVRNVRRKKHYYTDSDGVTHYGIATKNGLWPKPSDSKDLSRYKLRVRDFIHAFFSMLVFGVLVLLDPNTVDCYYPSFGSTQKMLSMALPPVVGTIRSSLFVVFPNNRQGTLQAMHQKRTPKAFA